MAVFTSVNKQEIQELLTNYNIGDFISLKAINAGTENTNFFLKTDQGEYVLTIFELLKKKKITSYLELMNYLYKFDIPVPNLEKLDKNFQLKKFKNKPYIITKRLKGKCVIKPTARHCELVGKTLACIHNQGKKIIFNQKNPRSLVWWKKISSMIQPFLSTKQRELLIYSINEQERLVRMSSYILLPKGICHCDLFRDNILFSENKNSPQITGVIDFYSAGIDTFIFDIAVSINDWCIENETGLINENLADSWLKSYTNERPLTREEIELWPFMLKGAALCFWLLRLFNLHFPRPAKILRTYNPKYFENLLLNSYINSKISLTNIKNK